jgi:hypothetical protein
VVNRAKVAQLDAEGMTTREIGEELGIAPHPCPGFCEAVLVSSGPKPLLSDLKSLGRIRQCRGHSCQAGVGGSLVAPFSCAGSPRPASLC